MTLNTRDLEVHFCGEPGEAQFVVVFALDNEDQLSLVDSIDVGPFPDWEAISRRVMRHVIVAGQGMTR